MALRDTKKRKSAGLLKIGVEIREGGKRDDSQILGLSNRVDDDAIH